MRLKFKSLFAVVFAALSVVSACSPYRGMTPDEVTAALLAERVVPDYARNIVFCQIEDTLDVFELSSENGNLVIRGNNANSMATGLNHYLRDFCNVTVSWYASDPVQCPEAMPMLSEPVRIEARIPNRFFLNYCTFCYTMPWWKWEDWERFIDWMALNGVNMPLANAGQEAVWQKVWRKHGLTDEQIRAYFTGPGHLAWHRMSNIDHFDGPLPQNWIDSQAKLQKKILERERALNMKPVLSAFSGHVPEQLKDIYPESVITDIPLWGGFPKENLCHFLSPTDTLYAQIQKEFMQEQEEMYGTDHIYGVDLFNEVEPPSWDPQTLAAISSSAYESMAAVDPEAIWLQMGWMFYYDSKNWTPENIKAYLEAVPQGKVVILDYYIEDTPVWTLTDSFNGQPYILCYLGNFGGNVWMTGDYHKVSQRIEEAFAGGGNNLVGIGSTLEGFGVNMFMYESVLDKAWNTGITDEAWIRTLADRMYGEADENVRKAYKTLTDSVYVSNSFSSQSPLTCGRPCLDGFWYWTAVYEIEYDNSTLVRIWRDLLEASSERDSYRSLVVTVGAQAIENHFVSLRDSLTAAYRAKDVAGAERAAGRMMEALADLDALAACDPHRRLGKWLADASAWGVTPDEAAYYRRNARTLITTWGHECSIRDYASRAWSGLIDSYYAPRWQMFCDEIIACIKEGREYDEEAFFERLTAFEDKWAAEETAQEFRPATDYMELSKNLLDKYFLR